MNALEIEKNFAAHPLELNDKRVFIGTAIDTEDGEMYEQCVCSNFESCVQLLLKLASEMQKDTKIVMMKDALFCRAFQGSRYGLGKGGLVAQIKPNEYGNCNSRFYVQK